MNNRAFFLLLSALASSVPAGAQSLALDASFGTAGIVSTSFPNYNGYLQALAVQPDQRLVVAGNANTDWLLARYLPSGALDPSFGTGGLQLFNFGFSNEDCYAVAIQPADSKIIVGGQGNGNYALLRLLPNGQPDPTFDGDGRVQLSFGAGNGSTITQVLVQPDGKIVATGYAYSGTSFDFAAARFLPNGAPDATFGTGGKTLVAVGPDRDQGRAALLQPDGKVVIVGDSYDATGVARFGACRLTVGGALDPAFGTGGKTVATPQPGQTAIPWAVVRQPDGKLVAAGQVAGDVALARYSAGGALDAGFGSGGFQVTDFAATSQDVAFAVAVQPNGRLVVAGHALTLRPNGLFDHLIARFLPSGALDTSFGTGGSLRLSPVPYGNELRAIGWQADGKPVFAGTTTTSQANGASFNLVRLTSAGVTGAPAEAQLAGATVFPNPVAGNSAMRYALARPGPVSIALYDAAGRRVRQLLAAADQPAGEHTLALTEALALPPGLYFVQLTTPAGTRTLRLLR